MSIKQRNVSEYPEYEYEIRSDADGQHRREDSK